MTVSFVRCTWKFNDVAFSEEWPQFFSWNESMIERRHHFARPHFQLPGDEDVQTFGQAHGAPPMFWEQWDREMLTVHLLVSGSSRSWMLEQYSGNDFDWTSGTKRKKSLKRLHSSDSLQGSLLILLIFIINFYPHPYSHVFRWLCCQAALGRLDSMVLSFWWSSQPVA